MRTTSFATAALFLGVACGNSIAATFQWTNVTDSWSNPVAWHSGVAPSGTSSADILVFAGDAGTTAGAPPNYTAINDFSPPLFLINGVQLIATDAAGLVTDPSLILSGNPVGFGGSNPGIVQDGAGSFTFNLPIVIPRTMRFGGNGAGVVTLNRGISGLGSIVKTGTSVFRFGTFPPPIVPPATTSTAPSENTWFGPLDISDGVVRFNNNADSGRTAVRGNPVALSGNGTITCASEFRLGTLSGADGTVESQVAGANSDSEDIILSAFGSGDFGGTLRLGGPTGTGNDVGTLVVRGPGTQTLSGTLNVSKDVAVGGSLIIGGAASLSGQTVGAIIVSGGTFRLENATTNNNNRLRDAVSLSTGLDTIGGGLFQLSGNAAGTTETIGRLQLSALTGGGLNKGRSGQLSLQVVHRADTSAATALTIAGYSRDATVTRATNTVEFSAYNATGTALSLGLAGANPRMVFSPAPTLSSSLLNSSAGTASVGWATVQTPTGIAFATHGANGIAPATTTTLVPGTSGATVNSVLTASANVTLTTYAQNSVRIAPTAAGGILTLSASTTLSTTALALAGANDFTITGGTLGGGGPRFVTVEKAKLTIACGLGATQMLVKSGGGTLALTKSTNGTAATQATVINGGTLLATPGTTLPAGELRFRGGVLGIVGGGTFSRPFLTGGAPGQGTVNWSGLEFVATPTPTVNTLPEERGNGGFAAIDADASVDLGLAGVSDIRWEEKGFLQSGFALVLGSPLAGARITFLDNLSLSSGENTINYNAREIRVPNNPATALDRAVISGVIGGTTHNDLLKTGTGTLELAAANTYAGATIVHSGVLIITGSNNSTIVDDIMAGATLGGSGSTGPILLESAGTLSPGDNNIGTLSAASLTWRAEAVARFELGSSGTSDRIALGGGHLEKGSPTGTFAFDFAGTGATGQTYTLATFGSTTFTAADFTATNLAASVTGRFIVSGTSLIFSTVPPQPMDNWRTTYFGPGAGNSGNSADTADPDFDGLSNLAEYALGANPLVPGNTSGPAYTLPGGVGTFTFTRNLTGTDVTFRIEARDSLNSGLWHTIATRAVGASNWVTDPGICVTDSESGSVTTTDTATPGTQSQRFLRLAIDHP